MPELAATWLGVVGNSSLPGLRTLGPSFEVQDDAAKSVVKTAAPSNLPLRIASKASFA